MDKIETEADLNVDIRVPSYKNDMEKDVTLDLQMKPVNDFITKKVIQIIRRVTWITFFSLIYKRYVLKL